jgi:hypothetical protein
MALNLDTALLVNLFFCVVIVLLGLLAYMKTKKDSPLYIAGAFFFFGISHVAGIMGMADALATLLMILRVIGYLLVVAVLCMCYARAGRK